MREGVRFRVRSLSPGNDGRLPLIGWAKRLYGKSRVEGRSGDSPFAFCPRRPGEGRVRTQWLWCVSGDSGHSTGCQPWALQGFQPQCTLFFGPLPTWAVAAVFEELVRHLKAITLGASLGGRCFAQHVGPLVRARSDRTSCIAHRPGFLGSCLPYERNTPQAPRVRFPFFLHLGEYAEDTSCADKSWCGKENYCGGRPRDWGLPLVGSNSRGNVLAGTGRRGFQPQVR